MFSKPSIEHIEAIKELALSLELEQVDQAYLYKFSTNYNNNKVTHMIDLSACATTLWAIMYRVAGVVYDYGKSEKLTQIKKALEID